MAACPGGSHAIYTAYAACQADTLTGADYDFPIFEALQRPLLGPEPPKPCRAPPPNQPSPHPLRLGSIRVSSGTISGAII
jgi:hypothetical protein